MLRTNNNNKRGVLTRMKTLVNNSHVHWHYFFSSYFGSRNLSNTLWISISLSKLIFQPPLNYSLQLFCSSSPKGPMQDHSSSETESDYPLGRGTFASAFYACNFEIENIFFLLQLRLIYLSHISHWVNFTVIKHNVRKYVCNVTFISDVLPGNGYDYSKSSFWTLLCIKINVKGIGHV